MKHWLQLIAIPNTPSSSGPELQSLKKRIADLEKARSRSPRRKEKQALGAGPYMLALPAPASRPQGSKARRAPGGQKNFEYLMKLPVDFRKNFHEMYHKRNLL